MSAAGRTNLRDTLTEDTRDARMADDISSAENTVTDLRDMMLNSSEDAERQNALGHAGLYEEVAAHLSAALKDLARAYAAIANGDPEDYR